MAQPYVGEIRMFAGNFSPAGWEFCNGQTLQISENETLYQLIGTTYGGDGQSTFVLPDMRGRVPVHMGTGTSGTKYQIAEAAGTETVTLTVPMLPAHTHTAVASANPASAAVSPGAGVPGHTGGTPVYGLNGAHAAMKSGAIGSQGGAAPHDNMAPYLGINFIISLFGLFPSPT
ncbi:tail fiber protein [Massilia sp. CCM 9210]|uniref:phage tail protein n=1 Tax=Massilia scottii TaxID=3057166 RepID=UPI002796630E|nr:tail fiber protein [Massilia sp. CCM 9210]MDQ1816882.1 tail fiber protein [Massilia sp. CCM 9210]